MRKIRTSSSKMHLWQVRSLWSCEYGVWRVAVHCKTTMSCLQWCLLESEVRDLLARCGSVMARSVTSSATHTSTPTSSAIPTTTAGWRVRRSTISSWARAMQLTTASCFVFTYSLIFQTHPIIPEPEVTIEVLKCIKRMNDFALAVRYIESLQVWTRFTFRWVIHVCWDWR